jgi:hypothetical protein
MSRSGYSDDYDYDPWAMIRWRGAVTQALRGRRGQDFLREMLAALDALPEKKLITREFQDKNGCVCALGAVAKARGVEMPELDPDDEDPDFVSYQAKHKLNVTRALASEVMWHNDEVGSRKETPEERWVRVRKWIEKEIKPEPAA